MEVARRERTRKGEVKAGLTKGNEVGDLDGTRSTKTKERSTRVSFSSKNASKATRRDGRREERSSRR